MPDDSTTPEEETRTAGERVLGFCKRHWHILLLLAIMAAAFLLRLYYLGKHTEYTADSYYFMILARSIRDTFTYTVRGVAHTKYLPGYPITIWLGGYIFGSLTRAANMMALLGATFTVLVTYGIGYELFNKWAGLVAALIVAFQPTFLKWTVLPMTEGLFTFLFAAGIYLFITGSKRASPARRTLGAISGGLCFLVRWEGLLFLPLAVLVMLVYIKGSRLRWWEPAVILIAFGLPMGIYVTRNLIVTGKVTSYVGEFREYSIKVTLPILKHRAKVYIWNGMSDALFSVAFGIGAVYMLVRKKWRGFLIAVGWFSLFAGFHLFWYYAYERFMAPAVPAVALVIGFLFADLAALSWAFFKTDGWVARKMYGAPTAVPALEGAAMLPEPTEAPGGPQPPAGPYVAPGGYYAPVPHGGIALEEAEPPVRAVNVPRSGRIWLRTVQVVCLVVLAVLLVGLVGHGLARANEVIKENYLAFADDHGGNGMKQAADWLNQNAPGQLVAADAGPYFDWLYYPGDVLYLRPVPWDLPVEPADVAYTNTSRELYQRGVRYMVIGQTEKGVADELQILGLNTPEDMRHIRPVAQWTNHYAYPTPHDLQTVIFEVLPPG